MPASWSQLGERLLIQWEPAGQPPASAWPHFEVRHLKGKH
jgi:hypothetical protein